ncbi:hypothetical protein [Mesorhizobium sp. M0830]|uniref:hypothetical protein n=1 Tax=Mesorhizobium sp. M0830 TaxID=2957008 RepID=UPI00333B850E
MTSPFTAVLSCCSRFGVAVLLPALAEFLFYGQPAGITVFLFAFLLAARIALGKSNEWLLSANLPTLSLALHAGCLINFAALIANYNVAIPSK